MSAGVWLAVAGAGAVGALARFLVDGAIAARLGRAFPFGTLTINLTGAFVLGLLVGLALHGDALVIAGTATIGSFTTFSTWMLESQRLTEDGAGRVAAANLLVSLVLGVALAALGWTIGAAL